MGYNDREMELRAEGMRVVPGVLACMDSDDVRGAAILVDGYIQAANKLGVNGETAWAVLWSGTMHWLKELADSHAELAGVTSLEVAQNIGASAASWTSEVHGVGGF